MGSFVFSKASRNLREEGQEGTGTPISWFEGRKVGTIHPTAREFGGNFEPSYRFHRVPKYPLKPLERHKVAKRTPIERLEGRKVGTIRLHPRGFRAPSDLLTVFIRKILSSKMLRIFDSRVGRSKFPFFEGESDI